MSGVIKGAMAKVPPELVERLRSIRLLGLDVDGVLTDGRVYFHGDGSESKAFNILDGHGLKMLQRCNIEVAIISGRRSGAVRQRAAELSIQALYEGCGDKQAQMRTLLQRRGLSPDQAAYMGDDQPDVPVMRFVGLGLTVANAHPGVISVADWCSLRRGGEGAVREACDLLLAGQGHLDELLREAGCP